LGFHDEAITKIWLFFTFHYVPRNIQIPNLTNKSTYKLL
jgi:hypothetical protein